MPPETKNISNEIMRVPLEPFSSPEVLGAFRQPQPADPETSAHVGLVTKETVRPGSSEENISRRTDNLFMHPEGKFMRMNCFGAGDQFRLAMIDSTHAEAALFATHFIA